MVDQWFYCVELFSSRDGIEHSYSGFSESPDGIIEEFLSFEEMPNRIEFSIRRFDAQDKIDIDYAADDEEGTRGIKLVNAGGEDIMDVLPTFDEIPDEIFWCRLCDVFTRFDECPLCHGQALLVNLISDSTESTTPAKK